MRINRLLQLGLLCSLPLLPTCSADKGTTQVTFNLGGEAAPKIAHKIGDEALIIVVKGEGMDPQIVPVPLDQSTLSIEVPNGLARVFKIVFYGKKLIQAPPGQQFPPIQFAGGAYYEGSSAAVDLAGVAVEVNVDVTERTDLLPLTTEVKLVNSVNTADVISLFGADTRAIDLETGYEYAPMSVNTATKLVYPQMFVPGKSYRLTTNVGNGQNVREFVATPGTAAGGGGLIVMPPVNFPFTPIFVHDLNGLIAAIIAANNSPGVQVIDLSNTGTGPLILNPTAPLPPLLDNFGTVIRGRGPNPTDVVIDGVNVPGPNTFGLRLLSSRNMIRNLMVRNFAGGGVLIAATGENEPMFNKVENSEIHNNSSGGIEIHDAHFTFIGTVNRIISNGKFGVRVGGHSSFALVTASIIKGPLNPPLNAKTVGVVVQDDAKSVSVGDPPAYEEPLAANYTSSGGNIINNCAIGVEVRNAVDDVSIAGNSFGFDVLNTVIEPNKLAVFISGGQHVEVVGNQIICNGDVNLPPSCGGPTLTSANLPNGLLQGGGVTVAGLAVESEVRRNLIYFNRRGVLYQNGVGGAHLLDHNSVVGNLVGVEATNNVSGVEVINNIVAKNACGTGPVNCFGFKVDPSSTFANFGSNLLDNFGPADQDCDTGLNSAYCAATIDPAVPFNKNISCSTSGPCNPLFNNTSLPIPLDLGLQTGSPAIDQGTMQSPSNPPQLGVAPDIGAIESH